MMCAMYRHLVPRVKVVAHIIGIAETIVVLLGCPRLTELIHLSLEGEWDTVPATSTTHYVGIHVLSEKLR